MIVLFNNFILSERNMAPLKPFESLYFKAKGAVIKLLDRAYKYEAMKTYDSTTYDNKAIEIVSLKEYFKCIVPTVVGDDFLDTLLNEERFSDSDKYRECYCFDVALLFANDCSTSVSFNRLVEKHLGLRSKYQ